MYQDIFTKLGLSANEAIIYEYLLENGEQNAGEIIKKTPLKRGVVYNCLSDLEKKGLISQKMKVPADASSKLVKKIAYFSPEHPEKLREFLNRQESEVKTAKNILNSNISNIVSSFHLASSKPGVRYYEGMEGVKKVINDTLTSSEEVYTYGDFEAVDKYIKKINDEYAHKRDELGIRKKILASDTPYNREVLKTYHQSTTTLRIIKNLSNIYTVMQIYDNKISYITLSDDIKVGVIIESKDIYNTNRVIFENMWNNAQAVNQLADVVDSTNSKQR